MNKRTSLLTVVALLVFAGAAAIRLWSASASGVWTTKAPIPETRGGSSSGVIDGKIYVFGGSDQFGYKPLTTLVYDGSADSWSNAAGTMNIAQGRAFMASGVISGKVYAAEGWVNADSSLSTTALEIYDPVTDSWTSGPSSLIARGNSASAVINGKLYITGGASNGYSTVFDQLEVFDPAAGTWSLLAPIPIGIPGQRGAAINGKFYVVGGYSPSQGISRNDLQIYDPVTNSWMTGPPMPTARSETFVDVIGGKLYVVGGNTNTNVGTLATVEVFDPATNSWSTEAPAPTARASAVGGVVGSTLYVTAGYAENHKQETEAFNAGPTPTPSPDPTPTPFNFTGFFQPVENLPGLNIANAGSSIPVKFSLSGYQGLGIIASGYPASGQIPCDANEPGTVIEETATAGGSTLSYDSLTDQFTYVWKTSKAWKATCRILVVRLSDGTDHYAKFRFK